MDPDGWHLTSPLSAVSNGGSDGKAHLSPSPSSESSASTSLSASSSSASTTSAISSSNAVLVHSHGQLSISPHPLFHGALLRQSAHLKKWEQRYYILRDEFLFCCKSQPDNLDEGIAVPYSAIYLPGSTCRAQPTTHHQHAFLLVENLNGKKNQHILCAASETETQDWVKAIQGASQSDSFTALEVQSKKNAESKEEENPIESTALTKSPSFMENAYQSPRSRRPTKDDISKDAAAAVANFNERTSLNINTAYIATVTKSLMESTPSTPVGQISAQGGVGYAPPNLTHFPPPFLPQPIPNTPQTAPIRTPNEIRPLKNPYESDDDILDDRSNTPLAGLRRPLAAATASPGPSSRAVQPRLSPEVAETDNDIAAATHLFTSAVADHESVVKETNEAKALGDLCHTVEEKIKTLKAQKKLLAKEIKRLNGRLSELSSLNQFYTSELAAYRSFATQHSVDRLQMANSVVALKMKLSKSDPDSIIRANSAAEKSQFELMEQSQLLLDEVQDEIQRMRQQLQQIHQATAPNSASTAALRLSTSLDEIASNRRSSVPDIDLERERRSSSTNSYPSSAALIQASRSSHYRVYDLFFALLEDDAQLRSLLNVLHRSIYKLTQDKINDFNAKAGITLSIPAANASTVASLTSPRQISPTKLPRK